MADSASATLTAEDTWAGPIIVSDDFDVSVSGAFNGTLTIQRKRVDAADSAYVDIDTFTSAAQKVGHVAGFWAIRIGFKTGEYTSGSAIVMLSI